MNLTCSQSEHGGSHTQIDHCSRRKEGHIFVTLISGFPSNRNELEWEVVHFLWGFFLLTIQPRISLLEAVTYPQFIVILRPQVVQSELSRRKPRRSEIIYRLRGKKKHHLHAPLNWPILNISFLLLTHACAPWEKQKKETTLVVKEFDALGCCFSLPDHCI